MPEAKDRWTHVGGKFYLDDQGRFTSEAIAARTEEPGFLSQLRYIDDEICMRGISTRRQMFNDHEEIIGRWMGHWSESDKLRFAIRYLRGNGTPACDFAVQVLQGMLQGMSGDNSPALGGSRAT